MHSSTTQAAQPSKRHRQRALEYTLENIPGRFRDEQLADTAAGWLAGLSRSDQYHISKGGLTATTGALVILAGWATGTPLVTPDVGRHIDGGNGSIVSRVADINAALPRSTPIAHPGITAFVGRFVTELGLPDWVHAKSITTVGSQNQCPPESAATDDPVGFAAALTIKLAERRLDERPAHLVDDYGTAVGADYLVPPATVAHYTVHSPDTIRRIAVGLD
jgi:hypothetical protein